MLDFFTDLYYYKKAYLIGVSAKDYTYLIQDRKNLPDRFFSIG